jgi:hypothetical protein
LLCLLCLVGCEAQFDLSAKAKLTKKVDFALADLNQRREEIGQSLTALQNRLLEIRKAKITVQVQTDLLSRKIEGVERRGGGTADLSTLAEGHARLQGAADTLDQKQVEIERRLAAFQTQLAVIDSHKTALAAVKKAAEALSDAGFELADLQAKVDAMEAEVRAELDFEQSRLEQEDLLEPLYDVQSLLDESHGGRR